MRTSRGIVVVAAAVLLGCGASPAAGDDGYPASDRTVGVEPSPPSRAGEGLAVGWAPPSSVAVRYATPVSGRLLRPFEPPASTFGAGHRGVDLDAAVGDPVGAAAAGTVHHAGPVGDHVWVSVAHADGVLTSYGPLQALEVSRGDQVARGQPLGRLAPGGHGHGGQDRGVHWGARRGLTYLDPLSLLDDAVGRPSLVGEGGWRGIDHATVAYEPWEGSRAGGLRLHPSPAAEGPGYAVPPSPNHLVMVPGLGSDDQTLVFDPGDLGYPPASVTYFSYAGREDPDDLDPGDPRRDQRPYGPEHTGGSIEAAAALLEEQLRAQKAREPGRGVDLVAYSQGGLVVLYYLTHLHDPYDPGLPTVARVVTIATPHQGSPLATAGWLAGGQPVIGGAVEMGRGWVPAGGGRSHREAVDLDADVIGELAAGSPFLAAYARAWDEALLAGPEGPLAMNTEILTIAGATDLAVPTDHAALPDRLDVLLDVAERRAEPGVGTDAFSAGEVATSTVLPGGHQGVLGSEAVREAAWTFLAGDVPTTANAPFISNLTDEVGLAATLGVAYSYVHGGFAGDAGRALHRFVTNTDALDPEKLPTNGPTEDP